jgi:hypothetical protein
LQIPDRRSTLNFTGTIIFEDAVKHSITTPSTFRNYDVDKEFEKMRDAGIFTSVSPKED